MELTGKSLTFTVLLLAGLAFPAGGAAVKPLEVFSEKIYVLEIENLAREHALSSAALEKAVDRLGREMSIVTQEAAQASLQRIAAAQGTMAAAQHRSAVLCVYIATNSRQLQAAGHGRFLPLARLDRNIEKPYYQCLESYFTAAADLVGFCRDNFELIATRQAEASRKYDELYAVYVKELATVNIRSSIRNRQLVDFANEYPDLRELLPF